MMTVSYSATRGLVCRPRRSASVAHLRPAISTVPSASRSAGQSPSGGCVPGQRADSFGRVGRHPVEADLVAREEPAQGAARRVPAMTDHGHARLGRLGGDALQPADALARQRADLAATTSGDAAASA